MTGENSGISESIKHVVNKLIGISSFIQSMDPDSDSIGKEKILAVSLIPHIGQSLYGLKKMIKSEDIGNCSLIKKPLLAAIELLDTFESKNNNVLRPFKPMFNLENIMNDLESKAIGTQKCQCGGKCSK